MAGLHASGYQSVMTTKTNGAGRQESAIAETEEHARILRMMEAHLPVVVWAIDRDGIFTHHAGKALEAAGIEQRQYIGRNIFEIYVGKGATDTVQRAIAGQLGHNVNEAHDVVWENWHVPVHDANGEVTSVIGISLDVTEAKRAESALGERLALIEQQQRVIRELSTPIIEVWDRVLALPMLGVIDSGTTAEVMDNLLAQISEKGARFAVLDLTSVEVVDTGTAGHILKLIRAIRLLGADGIITGIRPAVAQTMVTLGLDLRDVVTLARLRDALQFCIQRMTTAPA